MLSSSEREQKVASRRRVLVSCSRVELKVASLERWMSEQAPLGMGEPRSLRDERRMMRVEREGRVSIFNIGFA